MKRRGFFRGLIGSAAAAAVAPTIASQERVNLRDEIERILPMDAPYSSKLSSATAYAFTTGLGGWDSSPDWDE